MADTSISTEMVRAIIAAELERLVHADSMRFLGLAQGAQGYWLDQEARDAAAVAQAAIDQHNELHRGRMGIDAQL